MVKRNKKSEIKAIDKQAVHRICSGQVVLDLATAVKELLENCVDAGATCIDIKLKEYGSELIEVSDNGTGVAPMDREKMMLKYHTSKLSGFDDLVELRTFGFRGEALSSLCAMAHVSVATRVQGEECGAKLEYDSDGVLVQQSPVARSVGTTVAVRDLFHSLPVRYKEFKKNLKRDYSRLISILQAYALISTNVRFVCTNQVGNSSRSVILATQPGGTKSIRDNVYSIYGRKVSDSLIEIVNDKGDNADIRIEGIVSSTKAGMGKNSADRRFFFVNGRPVDFSKANACLIETYKMYSSPAVSANSKPMGIINLMLPLDSYDVNVTPDKRKVFMHNESQVIRMLQNALVKTWEPSRSVYTVQKIVDGSKKDNHLQIDSIFASKECTRSTDNTKCSPGVSLEAPRTSPEEELAPSTEPLGSLNKSKGDKVLASVESDADRAQNVDELATLSRKRQKLLQTSEVQERPKSINAFALSTPSIPISTNRAKYIQLDSEESHQRTLENFAMKKNMSAEKDAPTVPSHSDLQKQEEENDIDAIDECTDKERSFNTNTEDSFPLDSPGGEDSGDDVQEPELPTTIVDDEQDKHVEQGSTIVVIDLNKIRENVFEKAKKQNQKSLMGKKSRMQLCAASLTTFGGNDSDPQAEDQAEEELERVFQKHYFREMRVIGQFNLGFIIAKRGKDLFIIDQHASGEGQNLFDN